MSERPIDSAKLVLYRHRGLERQVLLQIRDETTPSGKPIRYPGGYALFGGIIEPGESPQEAACREFHEELNLLLLQDQLPKPVMLERNGRKYFFGVEYDGREPLSLREGAGLVWMKDEAAIIVDNMIHHDQEGLVHVLAQLTAQGYK